MFDNVSTGVTIGFEMPNYTVPEDGGFVEVCAVVLDGGLERTVNITLETLPGSAAGWLKRCRKPRPLAPDMCLYVCGTVYRWRGL